MDVQHWHCMGRNVKESQRVVWFRKSERMPSISDVFFLTKTPVPIGAGCAAFVAELLHEDGHIR